MLPILSFLGLAFAASLWPESNSDEATEPETARDDLSASATAPADDAESSPLHFASATSLSATDTLFSADEAAPGPVGEQISGTAAAENLLGASGEDTLSGGAGMDQLDGGDGHDILIGDDDADGDRLIGGDGHDQLWLGADDTASGGSGDDIFHVAGDMEAPAVITDYNPDDDTVVVYYDAAGPAPDLTLEHSDAGTHLLADNQVLAIFPGTQDVTLDDIPLVPETAAA